MTSVSDDQGVMSGCEDGECVTDDAAPAKDCRPAGATSPPEPTGWSNAVSSTLPAESPTEGQARLSYGQRIAVTISILQHRAATQETCDLAIRALLGYDVVAEAGR